MDTATPEQLLRGVGLRVTRPRLAVLAAVASQPHVDTDQVIGLVREQAQGISHQAVYDVLRVLTDTGILRRIQPSGSVARYETRVGDNHHHLVCRGCRTISDVDCVVGHAPCLSPGGDQGDHGYVLDEAEVVFWGLCPTCAAASDVSSPAATGAAPQPPTSHTTEMIPTREDRS